MISLSRDVIVSLQIDAFSTLPCYELATAPTVPMLPTVLDLMERQRVLTHSKQELKKK